MRYIRRHTALRFIPLTLVLVLLLSLTACGGAGGSDSSSAPGAGASSIETEDDFSSGLTYKNVSAESQEYNDGEAGSGSRPYGDDVKLILRASLRLQSTDFDKAAAALDQLVAASEGYYETSNLEIGSYDNISMRYGVYTVRVPQKNYDSFLASVGSVCHVVSKSESAEDVGSQYYDAESRLKTLRTKHERLLSLLEKADSMEDIIKLEDALGDIQYQIDQYASKLSDYDSLIGYATIDIRLEQVTRLSAVSTDRESYGSRLLQSFNEGLTSTKDALATLLLVLAYNVVPLCFLLVVAAVVFAIFRRKKGGALDFLRKKKKRGTPKDTDKIDDNKTDL